MHRNPFWIVFLGLLMLGILGYTARTGFSVWQYLRLDKETSAQEIQWAVAAFSDEKFVPFARYRFHAYGKSYEGQTIWGESYLNQSTAQEAIIHLSKSPPPVLFNASMPEISSLQKHFPLKALIYTLILWILGIYFSGLGYYVKQRSP